MHTVETKSMSERFYTTKPFKNREPTTARIFIHILHNPKHSPLILLFLHTSYAILLYLDDPALANHLAA